MPATGTTPGLIAGADPSRALDLVLVNAPLRDYSLRPRVNDFTLPVLGMAYIATYAAQCGGFNVGVLDAEAAGLGIEQTAQIINDSGTRWAGFNLLAPTYEISATIADALNPDIHVMLGSHHAKARPAQILTDPRMRHCKALIIGEAETRATALLQDWRRRGDLPKVMWVDPVMKTPVEGGSPGASHHLSPDIDDLPFPDRAYLLQDPRTIGDRRQANVCGARGCPYNCTFCGAAWTANPDVDIRVRRPDNVLAEMYQLRDQHGVTAFRFVDDLFLGARRVVESMMAPFAAEHVGDWARWDATGRINVLDKLSDAELDRLFANGLREVALGIESGNARVLDYIDKRITPEMAERVVRRLVEKNINVKGYFIAGFPGESAAEIDDTVALARRLWALADARPGDFTASMFEFRPYPGTPEWTRLIATGKYTDAQLLDYQPVDMTDGGADALMFKRDEFNFSVGIPFSDAPIATVRAAVTAVSREQHQRNADKQAAPA